MFLRLVLPALLCLSGPAIAAEVTLVSYRFSDTSPVPHLHLSGVLEKGDAPRLTDEIARLARCSGSGCKGDGGAVAVISLDSPGGAYTAGVQLADAFRENAYATVIESGDECLSACAVAFLGGTGFWPTGGVGFYVDRVIEPGGRLGFHSPYFSAEQARAAVASGQLQQLLDTSRLAIADLVATLGRYNVSQDVLDTIIRMGADSFYEVSTPADLYQIRANLPDFDPADLTVPWDDQFLNVCSRLAALQYGTAPQPLPPLTSEDLRRDRAEDGSAIILYDLGDRPLNVSGCGMAEADWGKPIHNAFLYQYIGGAEDTHRKILSFQNDGWSYLGYDGGRATDGYLSFTRLNHMLMPLDARIDDLPGRVRDQMRRNRTQEVTPGLPTRSRAWPVTTLHETAHSRSSTGSGLMIVEQSGPARLFDTVIDNAEHTDVMYEKDGDAYVIRSGEDVETGTSYYWLALRSGNAAATIRIEAPTLAAGLTQAQKDLMGLIACSTDFRGAHSGCYK